jgi:UDP-N-acetyl-D-glucosamine dehydrogenase
MAYIAPLKDQIASGQATIGVIGLGYVGLPLAKGLARVGFPVVGFEENAEKVQMLLAGTDYIDSDLTDLPALLEKFQPTLDFERLGECQVVIICVPTPLSKNLEPDISYVEKVSRLIGRHIQPGTLVVLESTTYPGTTEEVVRPAVEACGRVGQVGVDYFLAFSPERVDPGNPHYNTSNTAKVLGGSTARCAEVAALVYEKLLGSPDLVKIASSTRAAEMEKLFENIFRSVNIALVNELAILCHEMGLDVWEIIELASTKPYGFMAFYPGPGIGGHCIPLDPFYLSWKAREFDFRTRFIELAGELNNRMPHHVVDLTAEALAERGMRGAKVLVVGAAYKANISDYRESPALKILDLLRRRGAEIFYFDSLSPTLKLRDGTPMTSVGADQLTGFDATVLVTVHDNMDLTQLCSSAPKIVDTRGVTRGMDLPGVISVLGCGGVCPAAPGQP